MSSNNTQNLVENLLTKSLFNLRDVSSGISLDHFIVKTIEVLMLIEREEYLKSCLDKGNGFYQRNFRSLLKNRLTISIPRTRNGSFSPATIELVKASNEQLEELSLSLYQKGMTSRDISDLITEFFGDKISKSSVNALASSFKEIRDSWQASDLQASYKVMYCDALYITVRRGNTYAKEPVYIAYGITQDNKRELMILESAPTESASVWQDYFNQLKERGVKSIDLIVTDGLTSMENAVLCAFPGSKLQKCVVHKMRNIMKYVSTKDKSEIGSDLTEIFDNFDSDSSVEHVYAKVSKFCSKWSIKYPKISNYFNPDDFNYYLTYISYPAKVRRCIYTTNAIENLNSKLRKATRNKLSFESSENLLDYLFVIISEYESKSWSVFPVSRFKFF